MGLLACEWAPAVPAGSSTHLSSGPSAGAGQYSRSYRHRSRLQAGVQVRDVCVCVRARVCVYVYVPAPSDVGGKGIYLWKVCFQIPMGCGACVCAEQAVPGSRPPAFQGRERWPSGLSFCARSLLACAPRVSANPGVRPQAARQGARPGVRMCLP